MKPILTFISFLVATNLFSQKIDWKNAPLNPCAIYYTLNHYNLNGPVKESNSISLGDKLFNLSFNEDGYLVRKLVTQPARTSKVLHEYEYSSKGVLKSTKMSFLDSQDKVTKTYESKIVYNDKGQIAEVIALPGNSKTFFNYDKNGNLISKKYRNESGKDSGGVEYTYNANSQIIKEHEINNDWTYTFNFDYLIKEDGNLQIEVFTYKNGVLRVKEGAFPVSTLDRQSYMSNRNNPEIYTYNTLGHEAYNPDFVDVSLDQYNNLRRAYGFKYDAELVTIELTYYNNIVSTITKPKIDSNCLNGNCIDGYGEYKTDEYTLLGLFKNGKANGYCLQMYNSGNYMGNFKDGFRDGFGTYRWKESNQIYIGEWKIGKQHGYGYYFTNNVISSAGYYENGKQVINMFEAYKNNQTSNGCLGNCTEGFGTLTYQDGAATTGFFKNGKINGPATITWSNKDVYSGNWIDNVRQGHGFYMFSDTQAIYYGGFENNKRNGWGMYFDKDSNFINKGIWVDNVIQTSM